MKAVLSKALICLLTLQCLCTSAADAATKSTVIVRQRNLAVRDEIVCPPDDSCGTGIFGEAELTAADLDNFVRRVNAQAPSLGKYYIEYGRRLGIRGDIAFAQAILETGYFMHIQPGQNNFAGIGAVGGGELGHFFATPADGVRAQLEHLWAYATEQQLDYQPLDPRFHLVKRGCAPTWEALGGKWAVPGYSHGRFESFAVAFSAGDTYGQKILKIYNEIKAFARNNMQ